MILIATSAAFSPPPPSNPGLPAILIDDRQLSELTDEAMAAVALGNDPHSVFVRGGTLARVVKDEHGQLCIERNCLIAGS